MGCIQPLAAPSTAKVTSNNGWNIRWFHAGTRFLSRQKLPLAFFSPHVFESFFFLLQNCWKHDVHVLCFRSIQATLNLTAFSDVFLSICCLLPQHEKQISKGSKIRSTSGVTSSFFFKFEKKFTCLFFGRFFRYTWINTVIVFFCFFFNRAAGLQNHTLHRCKA